MEGAQRDPGPSSVQDHRSGPQPRVGLPITKATERCQGHERARNPALLYPEGTRGHSAHCQRHVWPAEAGPPALLMSVSRRSPASPSSVSPSVLTPPAGWAGPSPAVAGKENETQNEPLMPSQRGHPPPQRCRTWPRASWECPPRDHLGSVPMPPSPLSFPSCLQLPPRSPE